MAVAVCAALLPICAMAASNVYTWVDQTGSGAKMWKGIAGSYDLSKLAAVEISAGHIYTSANGGASWTLQSGSGSRSWLGIASSPDGTHLSAITNITGNVYLSPDSGVTWNVQGGAGTRNWTAVAMASSTAITVASAYSDYIFISTTTGSTWFAATNAGQRAWQALAVSSDGSKIAAAVNPGGIYLSTDGGINWALSSASTTGLWQSIASSADGNKLVAVMHSGYVYTSANGGATWATSSAPYAAWQSVASSGDGTRLAAAIDTGDIYTSSDSGATWTDQTGAGSRIWFSIVSSADGSKLAATAYNGDVWTGGADITPPSVILDPTFNNYHAAGGAFNISSKATDDQGISLVQFYVNGASFGSSTESLGDPTVYYVPFDGTAQPEGTYQYFAVAKDLSGNYATSTPQTFYLIKTPAVITQVTQVPSTITGTSATYYYSASYNAANSNTQIASIDKCLNGTQITASPISPNATSSITIGGLVSGNSYHCTLLLVDAANNDSNVLDIGPFTVVAQASASASSGSSSSGGSITTEELAKLLAPSAATTAYLKSRGMAQPPVAVSGAIAIPVASPATTTSTFGRDLDIGSSGPDVTALQRFLNSNGYPVASSGAGSLGHETGYFSSLTKKAVARYQKDHQISPASGRFGPATRASVQSRLDK